MGMLFRVVYGRSIVGEELKSIRMCEAPYGTL